MPKPRRGSFVLRARGCAGLVLLSRPLSEEATSNFRKPSSVQGLLFFLEHLDHPWVLDRPIVECRFLSLGRRVASYDHGVKVVRVLTIHTSETRWGGRQGLPSCKARIEREQLNGVWRFSLECIPLNLALPYQTCSGSPGGQLCRETINQKVLKRPDAGLRLVFCVEVDRERKDSHRC